MSSELPSGEPLPVELMNTVSFDGAAVRDALATDAGVAAWLSASADRITTETEMSLDGAALSVTPDQVRDLRDALRTLAAEVTQDPRPPATAAGLTREKAIADLNALARTWPELVWPGDGAPGRTYRADGTAVDLVVGLIAHQGVELFAGSGRERVRACLAPNCLLFFFKQQTRREWCSPECGNRARVARHYERHHTGRRADRTTVAH
jgi:predicted RNA-binding Zn ribbon-like protein